MASKAVVDPALGHFHHRFHRVGVRRAQIEVGGPERARKVVQLGAGEMSIAMIRPAPAMAAPLIAAKPTPPQPSTATLSPGRTCEVWIAAPTPVITPQPMRAARSRGMSLRIATHGVLVHQHLFGERRQVELRPSASRRRDRRGASSLPAAGGGPGRCTGWRWPVRHWSQWPQIGRQAGDYMVAGFHHPSRLAPPARPHQPLS